VGARRAGNRRPGQRPGRGGVIHAGMNVGVVGNPSYRDLKPIPAHLAQVAPRLGFTLFTEQRIGALWPEPPPPPLPLAQAPPLDCLITLGGDATPRRGARA